MENSSFCGFDGLNNLFLRDEADMRPSLLRILTDLFVQKLRHTRDEERHYTELALRLLEVVDVPTRLVVAKRLARHLSPPPRVLQSLARDLPEIAALVQSHPLLQQAASADAAPHLALQLTTEVDTAVAADHVANAAGALDAATAAELDALFFAADASERRLILLNLAVVAPLPPERLGRWRDAAAGERLEAAALARSRENFAQQLARSLEISREQARRIARDELGEPVVVAGKALGVRPDIFHRILLFLNPVVGHSVQRVHALAALYQEMRPEAADGMVAIWQSLPRSERAAATHQPPAWNETRPRMRMGASMTRAAAAPVSGRRNAS